jgi:hypothetical protein
MMKKITLPLALLSVAMLAYDCSAEEEQGKPQGGKRGVAQGANRGQAGQGRGGQGRDGAGPDRDPAQMVARMMTQFDKDGDQKLDSKELTALLKSMRQRRGGEGQGQARQGRAGQGQPGQARQGRPGQGRQGAEGQRRRRSAENAGTAGGERPKRPADE